MKISTYNVNSINARLENLSGWLKAEHPDIVLLQEIKCEYNAFPFLELSALGYEAAMLGEKSYNGVAVLSRHKIKVQQEGLPGFVDEHARYLEATIEVEGQKYRVASIYLPNGNPPYNNPQDESKFKYKLAFMDALYVHAKKLLESGENVILGGDFNVIMSALDVYDEKAFLGNALYRPEVISRLKAIEYLGFYDAYRTLYPNHVGYTFWDYTGNAFGSDYGLRIDYLFLSPSVADKLAGVAIDKNPRRGIKPSDHTPLTAEINKYE